MAFLTRGDARLYFEQQGERGDWVTLVNGYTRTSSDFKAMGRHLAREGFRVLAFDNRGAGQTETPLDFTLDDIVEDVAALWDSLGIEASHLLGISYGGVVCLNVAARYPDRVQSVAFVSTTPDSKYIRLGENLYEKTPQEIDADLLRYFSPSFAAKNKLLVQALVKETAKAFTDPDRRERAEAQRNALRKFDFKALLAKIRMPTLVMHGTSDQVITPDATDAFKAGLPKARVELVQDAGHLLLGETPKRLYESATTFFKSVPSR